MNCCMTPRRMEVEAELMKNPEQTEFLDACRLALEEKTFKRVTFTSAGKGDDKFRAKFELVSGETKNFVVYGDNKSAQEKRFDYQVDDLIAVMSGAGNSRFKAALLSTETFDLHYSENRKGQPRLYRAKPSMKGVVQEHNRTKNYVLDRNRPYLKGLGVTNDKGVVVKKHYSKFRQIANFVEIIDRDIGGFVDGADRPISLLDLGCGKGYLTFAAYDYIRSRAKVEPKASGIDIKTNVIELCNNLSDGLGFEGLVFKNARIQQDNPENVDVLIALHACDTATDDALALGLRSNMQFFFCAPCCQAEIATQLSQNESDFGLVNGFPLMKRRQADIITDVCRALLLQAFGYEVKFLEFTALEHTSKNVMLAGRRSHTVDRHKAYKDYLALKESSGFSHHALEENTKDLLLFEPN